MTKTTTPESQGRPLVLVLGPLSPYLGSVFKRGFELVDLDPRAAFAFPGDGELVLGGAPGAPTLLHRKTGQDFSALARELAGMVAEVAKQRDLDGVILPAQSALAGLERLPQLGETGTTTKTGQSLVALRLRSDLPALPLEDTGRLNDPGLREAFVTRVYSLLRWKAVRLAPSPTALLDFHERHKYLLRCFSLEGLRRLGKLAARAGAEDPGQLVQTYGAELVAVLASTPTRKRHTDVLLHLLGYFKEKLPAAERQELLETIEAYRLELLPLIVPVTLINHHVGRLGPDYLARQWYLNPHPLELELRNHV
jgi:uncharacterized protein YbgA (DUF1722 family)